ncbi:hypothetical protein ON010_g113 [Phytophthora cinnamomi]|nr:hypothetical protein ON010_g113 [Phytophthora cinnamomi]
MQWRSGGSEESRPTTPSRHPSTRTHLDRTKATLGEDTGMTTAFDASADPESTEATQPSKQPQQPTCPPRD